MDVNGVYKPTDNARIVQHPPNLDGMPILPCPSSYVLLSWCVQENLGTLFFPANYIDFSIASPALVRLANTSNDQQLPTGSWHLIHLQPLANTDGLD